MREAIVNAMPAIQYWQLEVLVGLALLLAFWEVPRLLRSLASPRSAWATAIAASVAALALTSLLAPRTNRILYDEEIYQHIGQSLADLHRAEMCNDGRIEQGRLHCLRGEYNKEPDGYPHLLSLAYRAFGVRERTAWVVNNLCTALLPFVVFLTTVLLFADPLAGGYAAILAALMPQALIWGNTAAVEPSATLTAAGAVLAAAWFVRARTTSALLWAAVCAIYACQFRLESLLILPVVGAVVACAAPREFLRPRMAWCLLLGLALATPLVLHLIVESGQPWGSAGPRFSLAFLRANVSVNGPFYLNNARFPAEATVLAALGVGANLGRRMTWVVIGQFALVWGVYLVFYAGSYNYGADVRYSLLTYPPIALAAGLGAAALGRAIDRALWRPAVACAIVVAFCWFVPLVHAVGDEGWAARADVAAAREFAARVPPGGLVLTHNPSMFLLWGHDAAQLSLAVTDAAFARDVQTPRPDRPVYFHDNFWCTVGDTVQTGFCRSFRARYATELVLERRVRGTRFALYRVLGPGSSPEPMEPPRLLR